MLNGGCYCGAIRYRVADRVFNPTNCHCDICRRSTGAPCVAWFSVPSADVVLLAAAPTAFRSSSHATRTFCPTCGTQLSFVDDATPGTTDITIGSLDEPNSVAPQDHSYTSGKLAWLKLADGLPEFRGKRSAG